jgi:hypothetical protein
METGSIFGVQSAAKDEPISLFDSLVTGVNPTSGTPQAFAAL